MSEIQKILQDIEELKKKLEVLIEKKDSNLLDPNILIESQDLDKAITNYLEFIREKF